MVSKANTVLRRMVRSMRFFFIVRSFLKSLAENLRLFATSYKLLLTVYLVEGYRASIELPDLITSLWIVSGNDFAGRPVELLEWSH